MTKYITYDNDEFIYVCTEKNEKKLIDDLIESGEDPEEYERSTTENADGYVSIRINTSVRVY